MTTATMPNTRPAARASASVRGDAWLWLSMLVLLGLAWTISRTGVVKGSADTVYWMGVVGGSLMLLLLLYPLRKYWRLLRNFGRVKAWFWMHLLCGVTGPWLILVHAGFRIGSLNAGVALVSMLVVVASGVVGRFLYVRVQVDLAGCRASWRQCRERLGLAETSARVPTGFTREILDRLQAFEKRAVPDRGAAPLRPDKALRLSWQRWRTGRDCAALVQARLRRLGDDAGWGHDERGWRRRRADRQLAQYLDATLRVAQFSAYSRLFALWHVAHLPFVILLALSAVVHVVAVHAY